MAEPEIKNIHTYSSDMAEALRKNQGSVIKIALAEQEKRQAQEASSLPTASNSKKIFWLIGGVVVIVLGIGVVYFMLKTNTVSTALVPNQPAQQNVPTFISSDQQVSLDVTGAAGAPDLAKIITAEVVKPSKSNTLKSIFLHDTSRDFLTLLESTAPSALVRSLTDDYMIGTYTPETPGERQHLFLLFDTKDYNTAYASMLTWEQTMLSDMFPLFAIDVSGDKKELLNEPWKDTIIDNKDARVLYDNAGNPVLYYLFIDKNYFVISDSQDAIHEIITRLITKNIKPL